MFDGRLPTSPIPARCGSQAGSARSRASSASAGDLPPALPVDDALRRIEGLYKPYHRALRQLLTRVHRVSAPPY